MPPSADSTSTQTACVTPSTRKKRDSSLMHDVLKTRDASSLSETSSQPLSSGRKEMEGLTQESKKSRSNSKRMSYAGSGDEFKFEDIYVTTDIPIGTQQHCHEKNLSFARKNDGFLQHEQAVDNLDERRVSSSVTEEVSITSMVLHSENLARGILTEYERERENMICGRMEITAAIAELREYNKAATEEIKKLRLENEELVRKEAASTSKLDEIRREHTKRNGAAFVAAMTFSRALMLIEKESAHTIANSEIEDLRLQNRKVLHENTEAGVRGRLEIEELKASLLLNLTQVRSKKAELLKEKEEMKATANLLTQKLLSHLEFEKLRSERIAFIHDKEEAEARATDAADHLELSNLRSEKETLLRDPEVHRTFREEAEQKRISMEADLTRMQREKELLREKTAYDYKKLHSRYEASVKQLQTVTGLEDQLRSEIAARESELIALNHSLNSVMAEMAQRDSQAAAEVCKLMREKQESEARELRSRTIFERTNVHSKMHLAFLLNCGLLQPEVQLNGSELDSGTLTTASGLEWI